MSAEKPKYRYFPAPVIDKNCPSNPKKDIEIKHIGKYAIAI